MNGSKNVKIVKNLLEEFKCFDKRIKISRDIDTDIFIIPIANTLSADNIAELKNDIEARLPDININITCREIESQSTILAEQIRRILIESGKAHESSIDLLIDTLPKRYSIYPPLLLLPSNTLDTDIWQTSLKLLCHSSRDLVFQSILNFHATPTNPLTHLAINKPIPESDNAIRSPTQLTTLYGDFTDFWCHTVQNGIFQTWMPLHTMFSRGNIKEKARILSSYKDISANMDVVDMYAGIGYFTLSYLKRGAKRLFCWEINPYSVSGLAKGVKENGFGEAYVIKSDEEVVLERVLTTRCVIFLESNEKSIQRFEELKLQETDEKKLELQISHINLGLLPRATDSWPYTCKMIEMYGACKSWVHVHENVGVSDIGTYMEDTREQLQALSEKRTVKPVWLEKVKTFAPDVHHIVGDFEFV